LIFLADTSKIDKKYVFEILKKIDSNFFEFIHFNDIELQQRWRKELLNENIEKYEKEIIIHATNN